MLEESLRLAHLPGEEQGRVYHFRSVSLPRLPVDASRGLWQRVVENELRALAEHAVHGSDPRARFANAVFFDHAYEAIELLLHQLLRGVAPTDWFWPHVCGNGAHIIGAAKIVAIIEQLRQEPPSWNLVAEIVLSALDTRDPAVLFDSLPPSAVQAWLRELDRPSGASTRDAVRRLTSEHIVAVSACVKHYGWSDPRTLWLTSLAVIRSSSANWARVAAVSQTRTILQILANRDGLVLPQQLPQTDVPSSNTGSENSTPVPAVTSSLPLFPDDRLPDTQGRDVSREAAPTNAAGFLFLLNALRRLGIERSFQEFPVFADNQFVPRLLLSLAKHAAIASKDPILDWARDLDLGQASFQLERALLTAIYNDPRTWPPNLPLMHSSSPTPSGLLRAWALGVRRYCWRVANIAAREVVFRPGWVRAVRGELDVTLPMKVIDIRIRRAGLDINPGWLPWFGFVVRFHYVETGAGDL